MKVYNEFVELYWYVSDTFTEEMFPMSYQLVK